MQVQARRIRVRMADGRGVVREVDNSSSFNPSYFNWLVNNITVIYLGQMAAPAHF